MADPDYKSTDPSVAEKQSGYKDDGVVVLTEEVNASGHRDQLERQYGLLSICATALTIDNAWIALGGSITVSVFNGGPPGIIFEFVVACFYYSFIGASIAELASSIPSSGGVYHWASVTPGLKYGRMLGFFAGSINFFGWLFDLAAIAYIPANVILQMYSLYHPDFIIEKWHQFLTFVIINIVCCSFIVFGNKYQPYLQTLGLVTVVAGGIVTVIVVAAMPETHASNSFVWTEWQNGTGWPDGLAFLLGVLNGAFAIGTPDSVTHMAEEMPHPRKDLPKAIAAQIGLGFLTGFIFVISIMYGINDLDAVLTSSGTFPLATVYAQATGSRPATFGLLFIVFISIFICAVGTYVTVGRIFWTLARDKLTPFHEFFSTVNEEWSCPIPATVACCLMIIGLGAIQLGNKTAFAALVGSFIILTTTSYAIAILPHLLTGRKNVPIGPFWMGKWGYLVNGLSCLFIIFFNILYTFPYGLPTSVDTMNYNSVILVGTVALIGFWWVVYGAKNYPGPRLPHLDESGREIADEK